MKSVLNVHTLRDYVKEFTYGIDKKFTIYYDESNNIRKLYLQDSGFNVPRHDNFILGGIVLEEGQSLGDIALLRKTLRMQENATEIKLKHIGSGSFEQILGSPKMGVVLTWLIDHKIHIHYSNINILYWSIVDIIDSIISDEAFEAYYHAHRVVKNELYRIATCDITQFLKILKTFKYPDLSKDNTQKFLSELYNFLEINNPEDTNLPTIILKELIRNAKMLPELIFLTNNKESILIDNFSDFFLRPLYIFKDSTHIFDDEKVIEKILDGYKLMDGDREVSSRFSDSKNEFGIQLSDILTSFLGKYFIFIEEHSMTELLVIKTNLNATQTSNLKLLQNLINASHEVSNAFFHRIAPIDTDCKSDTFIHNLRPAPHLI